LPMRPIHISAGEGGRQQKSKSLPTVRRSHPTRQNNTVMDPKDGVTKRTVKSEGTRLCTHARTRKPSSL
jgi:hypothetical protein